MRHRALVLLLVLLVPLLAGCTGGPRDPGDDDENETTGDGGANGTPTPTTTTTGAPDARTPAPPRDQRVDSPDEVDRPGEYAMLPRANDHSDASWTVPAWRVGDTWRYDHEIPAYATVRVQTEDKVTGSGRAWEIDVYRVTRTEADCEGTQCVQRLNYTKAALVPLQDDGFIEHGFVFPLADGNRWVYARSDGRDGISKVTAEARHVENYLWPGTTQRVEAWRIVLDHESDSDVQERLWIGVDQKNLLRREIWSADDNGVPVMHWATTLKSYTAG